MKTATSYLELGRLPVKELFQYQREVVEVFRAEKKAREKARDKGKGA